MGYKKQAILGIGWTGLLQGIARIVSLVKFVIILRILTPFEFGLFGMTMVVVNLFETFSEFGIGTFLIQQGQDIKKYLNTIWTIQLGRGIVLMLFIIIIALPASLFFKQPQLLSLVLVGSLVPLFKSFENPFVVVFQKDLHFDRELIYRLIYVISDVLFSVWFCFLTKSVYGLLLGLLMSSLIGSLSSWLIVKTKPKLHFQKDEILNIFHFVKNITLLGIVNYITTQIDSIIVGRILGTKALGFYQVGQKFSNTPMLEVSDVFGKVSFPVYSKIAQDRNRLKKAYLKTILSLIILEGLALLFILFFAKEIIFILTGPQWEQSVSVLKIMAIFGFTISVWGTIGSLFFSVKKQSTLLKLGIIRAIFLIPALIIGVKTAGILGAGYALLASIIFILPFTVFYVVRIFLKNEAIESAM